MEHLEVVIYDEIDDYSEKIKGKTSLVFQRRTFVCIVTHFLRFVKARSIGRFYEKTVFNSPVRCDFFLTVRRFRLRGSERQGKGWPLVWLQRPLFRQSGK